MVGNSGLGYAHDVMAVVSSPSPDLFLPETTLTIGTMDPGGEHALRVGIRASAEAPAPSFPDVLVALSDAEDHAIVDTLGITLATERLWDDFESGEGLWTHPGLWNDWHLSGLRSHSGDSSWYCGVEDVPWYRNHTDSDLNAPAILIAPNARFSFWCWYEVAIYGVDGLNVEANDGTGWRKLDFIGSGGALDSLLNTGNDWHRESYDLSHYPVGTRVELRLRFESDQNDVAEGFYVDDVSSNCPVDTSTTSIGDDGGGIPIPRVFALYPNYPNPFNPSTTIAFDLPGARDEARPVSLVIYDVRGRRVRTLIDSEIVPGSYRLVWDGRDGRGASVSSGLYLYTLRSGDGAFTRKMTLLK
jgi:hypothetical protein